MADTERDVDETAIPVAPRPPKTKAQKENKKRLIIVIEGATIEVVKAGKDYQLLNCDDHRHIIRKLGRDIADCRPDITHQILLALLDSPLNKAGMLQVFTGLACSP
jgi:rRNA small subunit pseudouridine methyltransferase Nep1